MAPASHSQAAAEAGGNAVAAMAVAAAVASGDDGSDDCGFTLFVRTIRAALHYNSCESPLLYAHVSLFHGRMVALLVALVLTLVVTLFKR